MIHRSTLLAMMVGVASTCLTLSATGQNAAFTLCGTVTHLSATPLPAPWNGVSIGDPFTLTYVFHCEAADSDPNPAVGDYGNAISSFTFSAGPSLSISITQTIGPATGEIRTLCNQPAGSDAYEVSLNWSAGSSLFFLSCELAGPHGALPGIPCDALPCCLDSSLFSSMKHLTFASGFSPVAQLDGDIVGCSTCFDFASACWPGLHGAIACPCGNPPSQVGRGCANSGGMSPSGARLAGMGSAVLNHNDSVVFTATGMLPTATCIFLQGSTLLGAGAAFGDGVRCVGGNLERLYVKTASGGSARAPQAQDPSVHTRSAALGDVITPGSSRSYATYYRDPGSFACVETFNITQSIVVVWM